MNDDFSDDPILDDTHSLDELDDTDDVDTADDVYDENDGGDVMDIDDRMQSTFGNVPDPGTPFTMGDEVEQDEEDRRGM